MNYHSLSKASHAHAEVGCHGRAPVEDVDAVVADGEAQGVVEGGGVEEGGLLEFNICEPTFFSCKNIFSSYVSFLVAEIGNPGVVGVGSQEDLRRI